MSSSSGIGDNVLGPSFSVVIPLFNKAPHIRRAINSVLTQTYLPNEIIVVDDGSTDGGTDLVPYNEDNEAGVTLLRRAQPGAGGYAARNLGIHTARSEWIAFLDADDEWLPVHLSNLAQAISAASEAEELAGTFAGYVNVYPDGRRSADPLTKFMPDHHTFTLDFDELLRIWINLRACPIWTSAAAFRRRSLLQAGLFPDGRAKRGGDKDTWLRVSALGPLQFAPGVTAIYHRDAVNMVTRSSSTNVRHCICDTVEILAQQVPEHTRHLLARMLNQEMFEYGIQGTEHGAVDRETYRGFNKFINPLKFALLSIASTRSGATAFRAAKRIRNWGTIVLDLGQ